MWGTIVSAVIQLLAKFGMYELDKKEAELKAKADAKAEAQTGVTTGDDTKLLDGLEKIKNIDGSPKK